MTLALWLGITGIASFISIQISLLNTALEIAAMGFTGPYSNVPNIAATMNCSIGTIYAFCIHSAPLLLANFCGLIICSYCIMLFEANRSNSSSGDLEWDYVGSPTRRRWLYIGPSLLVFISFLLACANKIDFVGLIMMIANLGMMASPLWTVFEVMKTKSTTSMPISTSAMLLVNGVIWTVYGMLLEDVYITTPNAAGSALAFVQVGLWARYELAHGQLASKVGDYFFVGSFSDIDEYDADTIREDDDTILTFDTRAFDTRAGPRGLVPLRPPEPIYYGKLHPQNNQEAVDVLSPQSDISDLTWGTNTKTRFERVISALSPLSPSRKKKLTPAQYPFYGATL